MRGTLLTLNWATPDSIISTKIYGFEMKRYSVKIFIYFRPALPLHDRPQSGETRDHYITRPTGCRA